MKEMKRVLKKIRKCLDQQKPKWEPQYRGGNEIKFLKNILYFEQLRDEEQNLMATSFRISISVYWRRLYSTYNIAQNASEFVHVIFRSSEFCVGVLRVAPKCLVIVEV